MEKLIQHIKIIEDICLSVGHFREENLPHSSHCVSVSKIIYDSAEPKEFGDEFEDVLIAALWHDSIEDWRVTYNDLVSKYGLSKLSADIVFALTNEKGKTRKERANSKYYRGIVETKFARVVKLADRVDNLTYSLLNSGKDSAYFKMYKAENEKFIDSLFPNPEDKVLVTESNLVKQIYELLSI